MPLDWSDVQVFLAVERGGSARAAALALRCSHSTVSRRLDALEQQLGSKLFNRTPEGFALTAAGARILDKAQKIEAEIFDLERTVSGSDIRLQGLIRLTVPPPLAQHLLLPHLARFRTTYPAIDIELIPTYTYSDLSRRDADVAIRFSKTPDEHLVGRRLPPFMDAIYATPDYIAKHWSSGTSTTAEWISWPDTKLFANRVARSPYANTLIFWSLPTLTVQAEAARKGLGMAFLPCIMGDRDPELVRVPSSGIYDERPGWILTHPDLRKMERVRVFARFLADAIASEENLISGRAPRIT